MSNFVELIPAQEERVVPDIQVARQPLQLQVGDKVKFFLEENNSRIWHIKKAEDDVAYTSFNP